MKTDTSDIERLGKVTDRESLLRVNAELIANLQKRVNGARFRVQDGDSTKLGYLRCLVSAIGVYSQVLKEVEISEIKKELDELRELVKSQLCN